MNKGISSPSPKRLDFEDDEEPHDTQESTWRDDPKATFSDWTIQVLCKNSVEIPESVEVESEKEPESLVTYHVHKYVLACGKRKSVYFANLFQNGNFSEGKENISLLELHPLAAKVFPIMLDFLYDNEKPLKIHTESAVQLYYLGEYLDIRQLRRDVIQFCKKDISLANVDTYYNHAMVFHSDAVLGIIAKFLGENILNVTPSCNILVLSDPRLWISALDFCPKTTETSLHISKLMAAFVKCKSDTMDIETLHELTRADFIPKLDPDAALTMCALEDTLQDHKSDRQTDLSCLQERCVDSLSGIWQSLAAPDATTKELLLERKPSFLVELLLKSWKSWKSWKDANKKIVEYEKSFTSTQNELLKAQAELKKFKPIKQTIVPITSITVCGTIPVAETLVKQNPSLGKKAKTILVQFSKDAGMSINSPFGMSINSPFGSGFTTPPHQPEPNEPCPIFMYQQK